MRSNVSRICAVLVVVSTLAVLLATTVEGTQGVDSHNLPIVFPDKLNEGFIVVGLVDHGSANQNVPAPCVVNLPNNEGGYTEYFSRVEAESSLEIDADVHIALGITQGSGAANGRGEQTASSAWEFETVEVVTCRRACTHAS